MRDEAGRITRWMGTCTDISDLVEAGNLLANREAHPQEEVARSVAELDRVYETSQDLIGIVSVAEGRFVRVNPAATAMLGWSVLEMTASPLLDFVHPDDREATAAKVARLHAGVAGCPHALRAQR